MCPALGGVSTVVPLRSTTPAEAYHAEHTIRRASRGARGERVQPESESLRRVDFRRGHARAPATQW
eukprot:scaffold12461_cov67-Phaeocystis_antarctica.AAC.1